MEIIRGILDKYYAKKLGSIIRDKMKPYYLDKKLVYTKHLLKVYIKNTKWKEKEYVLICAIPNTECFYILTDKERLYSIYDDIRKACISIGDKV